MRKICSSLLRLRNICPAVLILVMQSMLPAAVLGAESEAITETAAEDVLLSLSEDGQGAGVEDLLPDLYDCRSVGKNPTVKSQGSLSTCWALTAVSALEAVRMPDEQETYSADHMSLANSFSISQEDGGDYKMIMAYLTGWQGPVSDAQDPYGDGVTDESLTAGLHVQEIQLMDSWSEEQFKRTIMSVGPVQTSLVMNKRLTDGSDVYYRQETYAYYYPEKEDPDHDVLIIGWDDNFSKENFAQIPSGDGAWICQNTWGEEFGDDGIFYVSFEDPNIASTGLAYTGVEDVNNYDCIYQTDDCGWQGKIGYGKSYCYFANVYEAKTDEQLQAVGFYATGTDTAYEVYLVTDYQSPEDLDHRVYLTGGILEAKGYYTITLPDEVQLQAGEKFAVIVNIDTPGSKRPVAVEVSKDVYTADVTLDGKEGYVSLYGGSWEHAEEAYSTNVCLKAYTTQTKTAAEE